MRKFRLELYFGLLLVLPIPIAIGTAAAQTRSEVITVYPGSDYINEVYQVAEGTNIKDGAYFSFYEGYQKKSTWKSIHINEDTTKGLKTSGFYVNNLKESSWTIYSPPVPIPIEIGTIGSRTGTYNDIAEEGEYRSDKKRGIWYTFLEQGKVIKRYDFDANEQLAPLVKPRWIYPAKAKAAGVEGLVMVKVIYQHCAVKKYKIVKDIGYGCGNAVVKSLIESHTLMRKYGINDVDCSKSDELITARFKATD